MPGSPKRLANTVWFARTRSVTSRPPIEKLACCSMRGAVQGVVGCTIAARMQSNLGFRVPGKIVERFVDVGQQVKRGRPLMRIDETDLRLALAARRNAVAAARAVLAQASADEKRYAVLVKDGLGANPQRYEQAKAGLDTAQAQLDAAEADAKVAENQAAYSALVADADGTVVATFGEPGQVVAAGQTVIQLAQAGQREALVALPETVRPTIGSEAAAIVYGSEKRRFPAHLRQISDAADARPAPTKRVTCSKAPPPLRRSARRLRSASPAAELNRTCRRRSAP
jgi:RND family efflux transporter MFP subunit